MATREDVSDHAVELDPESILCEIDAGMDELPEAALRACQRHREVMTPRLIKVIEEAVRLGREGTIRKGNAPLFALFLLTEFQVKDAFPVLLDLFSLRDPVLDGLIGGAVTEVTPRTLAILAGDQPDIIESLIPNQELDDFVRWEAAAALCYLVLRAVE